MRPAPGVGVEGLWVPRSVLQMAVQRLGPSSSHSHLWSHPQKGLSTSQGALLSGDPGAPASSLRLTGHWPSLRTAVPPLEQPVPPAPTPAHRASPMCRRTPLQVGDTHTDTCSPSPRADPVSPSTDPTVAPSSSPPASSTPQPGIQGPSGWASVPGLPCLTLPPPALARAVPSNPSTCRGLSSCPPSQSHRDLCPSTRPSRKLPARAWPPGDTARYRQGSPSALSAPVQ